MIPWSFCRATHKSVDWYLLLIISRLAFVACHMCLIAVVYSVVIVSSTNV